MAKDKKRGKVLVTEGILYFIDSKGNRVNLPSLSDANAKDAECCGIDCCNNRITLPALDGLGGTTTYPSTMEIINTGGVITLRITVTPPVGAPIVRII